MEPIEAGLCAGCKHGRTIRNARGGHFQFCARAKSDPLFNPYPPLPVRVCEGHEEQGRG